jgi:hypothetical protein
VTNTTAPEGQKLVLLLVGFTVTKLLTKERSHHEVVHIITSLLMRELYWFLTYKIKESQTAIVGVQISKSGVAKVWLYRIQQIDHSQIAREEVHHIISSSCVKDPATTTEK